ncbi:hypothetical protein D8674_000296 [Pyrus ussuriensis x Pyrus communis]|uniref:Transposon Ty3-I Gag-Pol polyprotein n=1 Tax=Pyrus ussuriensis x Pyrus communis TaxID=2448454 RepID=A0A5N5F2Y9_9ROSA|nr:hypothetical protein D8674_000296 [Pyrus ussuriensis x Pyrus communis]
MPGLDSNLVCHTLNTQPMIKPVMQHMRNFHLKIEAKIKVELANIVPVKKKNTVQIWICIDYRDLNAACPKNEFLLPNIDIIINSTSQQGLISFMDGFCGYNQIKISAKDRNINIDPDKVRTIRILIPSTNAKELKSLMRKLSYIRRFILRLAQLVTNLPTMKAPIPGIPLKLYLAATSTDVEALLAQDSSAEEQAPIYHVIRQPRGAETLYEKI